MWDINAGTATDGFYLRRLKRSGRVGHLLTGTSTEDYPLRLNEVLNGKPLNRCPRNVFQFVCELKAKNHLDPHRLNKRD